VSLVQDGPLPRFLKENAFQILVKPEVYVNELKADLLSPGEKSLSQSIREDPTGHQETILGHGFTGIVDMEHINDTTGTVTVNLLIRGS